MSARTRLFAGPVHGPTHRSAPTESIEIPVNPRRAGGDRAPPLPVDRGCAAAGRCGHRPLRKTGKPHRPPGPVAQSGASAPAVITRGGFGARQRSSPNIQQPRTIPQSRSLAATAPFAQGSLALRGTGERADTRVRPYVVIGIASSARRGGTEPAPYGSTGSAGLRADVPKAWPLPPKFRSEIWGVGHRHRPLRKGEKAASTTRASGAERSVCAVVARDGWESEQGSSPKGPAAGDNPSVTATP